MKGSSPKTRRANNPKPREYFLRLANGPEECLVVLQVLEKNQYCGTLLRDLFLFKLLTEAQVDAGEKYAYVCGRYSYHFGSGQLRTPRSPAFVKGRRDEKIEYQAKVEDERDASIARARWESMMRVAGARNDSTRTNILDTVCIFDRPIHASYVAQLKLLLARLAKHFRIKDRGVRPWREMERLIRQALRAKRKKRSAGRQKSKTRKSRKPESQAVDLEPLAHQAIDLEHLARTRGYETGRSRGKTVVYLRDDCGPVEIFEGGRQAAQTVVDRPDTERICHQKNFRDLKRLLAQELGYRKPFNKQQELHLRVIAGLKIEQWIEARKREAERRLRSDTPCDDVPLPNHPIGRAIAACGYLETKLEELGQERRDRQAADDERPTKAAFSGLAPEEMRPRDTGEPTPRDHLISGIRTKKIEPDGEDGEPDGEDDPEPDETE